MSREAPSAQPSVVGGRWEAEVGTVRLVAGPGRLAELGPATAALGTRALLVGDGGVQAAGHLERARDALEAAGCAVTVYADSRANPTSEDVRAAAEAGRRAAPDVLVAVGGGSVLDTAKAVNFVLSNGGRIEDYWGFGKASEPMLPSVAAPTTAGTGSEAQSYALVSRTEDGRKMACGDRKARFHAVFLDPELVATPPPGVAAAAAIDAMSHAIESWVTRRRNPVSLTWARRAWELLDTHVDTYLADRGDDEAASGMLLGAHLAGAAIETSMLGAAHAAANPLTARFGVPHGQALAIVLPAVVRWNASAAGAWYADLAPGGADGLAARIETLRADHGLPERLAAFSVQEPEVAELALAATEEWTGGFNPRPVGLEDFHHLYESLL